MRHMHSLQGSGGGQNLEETYDLAGFSTEKKKELVEFRLGYTEKGFTDFCKRCRGFTVENTQKYKPAIQA